MQGDDEQSPVSRMGTGKKGAILGKMQIFLGSLKVIENFVGSKSIQKNVDKC